MDYVAKRGTTALGIIGTALGGLAVAGGPLLAAAAKSEEQAATATTTIVECNENQPVSRYEAAQAARIAELETEVKLHDANTYTDQKMLELYKYVDGRMRGVEAENAAQKVQNQRTQDSFALAQADLAAVAVEQAITTRMAPQ